MMRSEERAINWLPRYHLGFRNGLKQVRKKPEIISGFFLYSGGVLSKILYGANALRFGLIISPPAVSPINKLMIIVVAIMHLSSRKRCENAAAADNSQDGENKFCALQKEKAVRFRNWMIS